ncbi:glutamine--fructose-6-phosphate transaminase (isomerizing) [candidate division KSB1 bacterium]|nr:glutamine--fructose-6-phosphate transaminase (isomerizing) [candidate division KSB1 bacterium]
MCGIVGYIGSKQVLPILITGLKRLEYRGYDSAGVALHDEGQLWVRKRKGKIKDLEIELNGETPQATAGIGHTRWATHGAPNYENAHPHMDMHGKIALVHNGIIENYNDLRSELIEKGFKFKSETDSEVLVNLISMLYEGDMVQAIREGLQLVQGTFGIAVLSQDDPEKIFVARRGSPLVIGLGEGETLIGSDGAALIEYTRKVIYLEDDEMAVIDSQGARVRTLQDKKVNPIIDKIEYDLSRIQKSGYPHFMLKEIFEQPQTIIDSMRGRLLIEDGNAKLGGLESCLDRIHNTMRFIITACGTSWHAGLIGEYLIERLAGIPVEVEYASEFRYRDPILSRADSVLAITQSGETADTLAALREAKQKGALALGMCNVVGSTIARESAAGVYLHAGPEIGVASTKAFTSQVITLVLIALAMGRKGNLSSEDGQALAQSMHELPEKMKEIFDQKDQIHRIAERMVEHHNALYLGRGFNYPVALEGALKMKEISYIHAEGYPSAEMKHGPIALIDEKMPVIFIAIKDPVYEKVISNIEEVKARGGWVIAVANPGDKTIKRLCDEVIEVPETSQCLTPVLTVVPLQLLAYYTAVLKGCDVDQPRNLAKSVTVE